MNIEVSFGEISMFELDILTHLNHHTFIRASHNYPNSSGCDLGEQVSCTQDRIQGIAWVSCLPETCMKTEQFQG